MNVMAINGSAGRNEINRGYGKKRIIMSIARNSVRFAFIALLPSYLAGCAPARTYELSSDKSEEGQACYDSCSNEKQRCYKDCFFDFQGEISCNQVFDKCLTACPGLTIHLKGK